MDGYDDSVMIALLPTYSDWCRLELPHVTLVYAGLVKDLPKTAFNEIAKDASSLAALMRPFTLKTMGTAVFGDEEKVDVIRLQPSPEIMGMRRFVERWNKSQYTEYKPHATIGPTGHPMPELPSMLGFNKICVTWGNDHLIFSLSGI